MTLDDLLASLAPLLRPGTYRFVTGGEHADAIMTFREDEGVTSIVPGGDMAWITLRVHSSLAAVGLTAAVSTALARDGIACNVVAAFHHDHLFVPTDRAADAMRILDELHATARP